MSINRYAAKVDANQRDVIETLELAGALVDIIKQPVDLLVGFHGRFMLMEVKNKKGKNRPTTQQNKFFSKYDGYPISSVDGPEAALRALKVLQS